MNNKEKQTLTRLFESEEIKRANIKYIMQTVNNSLTERGYNPVTQIVGYLITNDPAYISSYNNSRTLIQTVDRDEIIAELVRTYLRSND